MQLIPKVSGDVVELPLSHYDPCHGIEYIL